MDEQRLTLNTLRRLIGAKDWDGLNEALDSHPYAETAALLEEAEQADRLAVLRNARPDLAVEVFNDLSPEAQFDTLEGFREPRAARFLEEMAPDERADLFAAMPDELRGAYLGLLPEDDRQDVRRLTRYDESTAGGIMTSDFVRLREDMTIAEAIKHFRRNYSDLEMVYYFYVLDDADSLKGVVSLRQLISYPRRTPIRDIMRGSVLSVRPETDQEDVAEELSLYDFYALPVTDESGRMLGIVTFDDVMDVIEQEATEDQEIFAGLTPSVEEGAPPTIWRQIWRRLPWLVLFMALASVSGFVLDGFMGMFELVEKDGLLFLAILLTLQPMVTATAGNAGTQAVTISIQAISGDESVMGRWRRALGNEARLGVIIGLFLGLVAFARALVTTKHTIHHAVFLGVSASLAVLVCVTLSTCLGALLPITCKRMGLDPAVISSPLITSLMDVLSVTVYLALALKILPYFI